MDEFKTEKWTLEDGRRAERRVTEQKTEDGKAERVIEVHVEDERPLRLQQRVVEKSKPIVYERKVETLDPKTGNITEQRVESIEPRVQMQLVEHFAAANTVQAQSVEEDCDCHVTKNEMIETIVAAIKATRETAPVREVVREATAPIVPTVHAQTVHAQTVHAQTTNFDQRLNSLGLADEIAGRAKDNSNMDKILMGVIAAQVIALGYIIFIM